MNKLLVGAVCLGVTLSASLVSAAPAIDGAVNLRDVGRILLAVVSIKGLDPGDATIVLSLVGKADIQCRRPNGQIASRFSKEIKLEASHSGPTVGGRLVRVLNTQVPEVSNDLCRGMQTAELLDVSFLSGAVLVVQGGQLVLAHAL